MRLITVPAGTWLLRDIAAERLSAGLSRKSKRGGFNPFRGVEILQLQEIIRRPTHIAGLHVHGEIILDGEDGEIVVRIDLYVDRPSLSLEFGSDMPPQIMRRTWPQPDRRRFKYVSKPRAEISLLCGQLFRLLKTKWTGRGRLAPASCWRHQDWPHRSRQPPIRIPCAPRYASPD